MHRRRSRQATMILAAGCAAALLVAAPPVVQVGAQSAQRTAYLAGGCFWGTEFVFEHVRGVIAVTSGYARYNSAPAVSPSPIAVESVRIAYDPARVSYRELLEVFFLVAHDPTTRDRQGPDEGPEYRAIVLTGNALEQEQAQAYVAQLAAAKRFPRPIVTEVRPLASFVEAESFHQNYVVNHPDDPYVVRNDVRKLAHLEADLPALFSSKRVP